MFTQVDTAFFVDCRIEETFQ